MDTMDTLGMQNNNYSGNQSNELERLLNILKSIDELKMDLDYFKELIEKRILFEKERQEMDNEINNILSTISNRRSKAAPKYEFVGWGLAGGLFIFVNFVFVSKKTSFPYLLSSYSLFWYIFLK